MCLIAFAIDAAADCPLLVAANRDEQFERPTAALHRWRLDDGTEVIGGRDLRDGGTWLGVTPSGRMAWLTNVRDGQTARGERSRGELVARWLQSPAAAADWAATLDPAAYAGFNLVVGDARVGQWMWLSNRDPLAPHAVQAGVAPLLHRRSLASGLHTLSNASLDTPWPKARRLGAALAEAVQDRERRLDLLADALTDTRAAADAELPRTGVALAHERALSSPFVHMPERGYGTRCSTVLHWHADGRVQLDEWTHEPTRHPPAFSVAQRRTEWLTVA